MSILPESDHLIFAAATGHTSSRKFVVLMGFSLLGTVLVLWHSVQIIQELFVGTKCSTSGAAWSNAAFQKKFIGQILFVALGGLPKSPESMEKGGSPAIAGISGFGRQSATSNPGGFVGDARATG
jgi:hypothetical protein